MKIIENSKMILAKLIDKKAQSVLYGWPPPCLSIFLHQPKRPLSGGCISVDKGKKENTDYRQTIVSNK